MRDDFIEIEGAKGEDDLREWMLPVAAARMGELVEGEKEALMRIVEESID